MSYPLLKPSDIIVAHNRIKNYVVKTPILTSEYLDKLFNHKIYFKYEGVQVTGSLEDIIKYHALVQEHLKVVIESTSAVAFAGLVQSLEKNKPQTEQKLLVLISGSNV